MNRLNFSFWNKQRIVIIIFLLSLFVRLSYWGYENYFNERYKKWCDGLIYLVTAEHIIENGFDFSDETKIKASNLRVKDNLIFVRKGFDGFYPNINEIIGPIFPSILAVLIKIFNHNYVLMGLFNVFLSALLSVFIFILSDKYFNRLTAIVSSLWSILYFYYLTHIAMMNKEPFLWILVFSTVFLFINFIYKERHKIRNLLLFSLSYVILIHTDERYLAYSLLFGVLMFFLHIKNIKKALKYIAIYMLLTILLCVPWAIRNYQVFGKIILISTRTEGITDKIFGYGKDEIDKSSIENSNAWVISQTQIDSVLAYGTRVTRESGGQISEKEVKAMQGGLLPKKIDSKSKRMFNTFYSMYSPVFLKPFYTANGYRFHIKWSFKHNLIIFLNYGILLIFSIFGFYKLYFKKKKLFIVLLSVLIYHGIIHIVMIWYSMPRYRIPVDFIIIIVGSFGIVEFYKIMKINYDTIKKELLN